MKVYVLCSVFGCRVIFQGTRLGAELKNLGVSLRILYLLQIVYLYNAVARDNSEGKSRVC